MDVLLFTSIIKLFFYNRDDTKCYVRALSRPHGNIPCERSSSMTETVNTRWYTSGDMSLLT